VVRHRGRRDALDLGDAGGGDPRLALNRSEHGYLPATHAKRVDLAPKLARNPQQNGPKLIRDLAGFLHFTNH
jgi:hypothetical protein